MNNELKCALCGVVLPLQPFTSLEPSSYVVQLHNTEHTILECCKACQTRVCAALHQREEDVRSQWTNMLLKQVAAGRTSDA